MMIVGFSDGGGLGTYMDYYSDVVTKTVAIDYWAYGGYEVWMTSAGTNMDMKIYTNCASDMFDYGPSNIFVASGASPPLNFCSGSGLAYPTYVSTQSFTLDASVTAAKPFEVWVAESCGTEQKITLAVHGIGGSVLSGSYPFDANEWDPDTAGVCTGNTMGGSPPHDVVQDYAPVYDDIAEWTTGTGWSCRRRLEERELANDGFEWATTWKSKTWDVSQKSKPKCSECYYDSKVTTKVTQPVPVSYTKAEQKAIETKTSLLVKAEKKNMVQIVKFVNPETISKPAKAKKLEYLKENAPHCIACTYDKASVSSRFTSKECTKMSGCLKLY